MNMFLVSDYSHKEMAVFKKVMKKHIFLHPADKKRQDAAIKSTLLQNKKKYSDK